ncbi:MAG: TonB-dependent receptor [Saprospiraceae bacterium]
MMKLYRVFLTLILSSLYLVSYSQAKFGFLSGKILDKSNGEPIIGGIIRTNDDKFGTTTDIDGNYSLKLTPGNYTILANFISFTEQKIEVDIKEKVTTNLDVALDAESVVMEEVVITYTSERSSSVAQLIERKNSALVSDGISSELIRKTPDRNASDALKRVTGASIQEGKFAIIRGMNDRYNAGYLDGALLPSTESDRKAFAFDVIPASLIDKLQVIKAGAPDLAGDFGGGLIKISTKAIPEKFTQQLSIGAQIHSLTTFKPFSSFDLHSGERLNLLSSKRNLPAIADGLMRTSGLYATEADKMRLANNSKSFDLNWNNSTAEAMPNSRIAYSLGCPLVVRENYKIGLVMALNYADTKKISLSEIASFDGAGQVSDLHDVTAIENISTGGILNMNFSSGKTQISLNNLVNINSDFTTIHRTGIGNISDYIEVNNTANLVSYNRINNSILKVKHIFGNEFAKIEASVNYGNVNRQVPTFKIANYTKTPDDNVYRLSLGDFFNSSTGIFNSKLQEDIASAQVQLGKNFSKLKLPTEINIGGAYMTRNRDFESRNFVYGGSAPELKYNPQFDLSENNIGANQLYLVEKTSNDLAYYSGDQKVFATFISADQKLFKNLRAVYGLRFENADIHVYNDKVGLEIAKINQGDFLPSVNLTYSLSSKVNLRTAYFATVNRPEFRELAPFSFYAFDKNSEIRGNKDLKIANLNNFELRAEWFPSGSQVMSIGTFYKDIQNPIEFNIDVTQVFTTFTFNNEKSAKIYGLEFEFRKNLDFLGEKNIYKEISLFSNLALIKSKLQFEEGFKSTADRPLQGQSPYVLNCGINFEKEKSGWSSSLILNRIGRRIAYVGVDPKFGETRQDIYEDPRTVIDFQIGKNIGRLNLKLTLGDLLKNDLIYYQDANHSGKYEAASDRSIFIFKNGMTTAFSLNYSF